MILPKLRSIPEEYRNKMEPLCVFQVPLGWRNQYCGIQTLKLGKIQYYFVDNEFYFYRDNVYGYGDDCERVAYFSKAVLECLQHLEGFFPGRDPPERLAHGADPRVPAGAVSGHGGLPKKSAPSLPSTT